MGRYAVALDVGLFTFDSDTWKGRLLDLPELQGGVYGMAYAAETQSLYVGMEGEIVRLGWEGEQGGWKVSHTAHTPERTWVDLYLHDKVGLIGVCADSLWVFDADRLDQGRCFYTLPEGEGEITAGCWGINAFYHTVCTPEAYGGEVRICQGVRGYFFTEQPHVTTLRRNVERPVSVQRGAGKGKRTTFIVYVLESTARRVRAVEVDAATMDWPGEGNLRGLYAGVRYFFVGDNRQDSCALLGIDRERSEYLCIELPVGKEIRNIEKVA